MSDEYLFVVSVFLIRGSLSYDPSCVLLCVRVSEISRVFLTRGFKEASNFENLSQNPLFCSRLNNLGRNIKGRHRRTETCHIFFFVKNYLAETVFPCTGNINDNSSSMLQRASNVISSMFDRGSLLKRSRLRILPFLSGLNSFFQFIATHSSKSKHTAAARPLKSDIKINMSQH